MPVRAGGERMNLFTEATMSAINIDWNSTVNQIVNGLMVGLVVLIILLIGYLIGWLCKKGTVFAMRKTVDPALQKTDLGKSISQSGIDFANLIGGLVLAFVMSVAFIVAVQYIPNMGQASNVITQIALYLPRLIGGIIVLTVGIILVGLLAKYIETLLNGVFDVKDRELSKLISNLILIGLVAFAITLGLNIMLLNGALVYPLILGTVIIGAGAIIGSTMIDSLTREHPSFEEAAPYAKFLIYIVFITVGVAAIFSQYPATLAVLQTLAWGLAIAMALIIVPFLIKMFRVETKDEAKVESKETEKEKE